MFALAWLVMARCSGLVGLLIGMCATARSICLTLFRMA